MQVWYLDDSKLEMKVKLDLTMMELKRKYVSASAKKG